MKNINNINNINNTNKLGGIMFSDTNSNYTPYYDNGRWTYIYNKGSIFKEVGIKYLFAADATELPINVIPISTHVGISIEDIRLALKIFDGKAELLGTYGKKLAVSSIKIIRDKISGLYFQKGHDGGGIIGYDFCEKHSLPKDKVAQLFMIGKHGGFIKGAFQPSPDKSGIWLGPGTIKCGNIIPGEDVLINVFAIVGKGKTYESFEISEWFNDSQPWIEYFDKNVKPKISVENIIKEVDEEEINSRALALLKISKEFIHHPYINRYITDKILKMGGKYATSGGRYGISYPLVADNSVPSGCMMICDDTYKPGTTLIGFRYPVICKPEEYVVIPRPKYEPKGEWVRMNPVDVKEKLLGDFDIDTVTIMKHRPSTTVGYIDVQYKVDEFDAEERTLKISDLRDKIKEKRQNLVGIATIALASALEAKDIDRAKMLATVIQHQVDSLKKKITLPDSYKSIMRELQTTKPVKYMPNWWIIKNSLSDIHRYKKVRDLNLKIENTPVGKLVGTVYNTINKVIDELPTVYPNKSFVGIFGLGKPMNDKQERILKILESRLLTASKIKNARIRKDSYKMLSIEVEHFVKNLTLDNVVWYWNYVHQNREGYNTLAVWMIVLFWKDELKLKLSNAIKFNVISNNNNIEEGIYEPILINNHKAIRNVKTNNIVFTYKDQEKFIPNKKINIIKVEKISNVSSAVYSYIVDESAANVVSNETAANNL